MDYFEVARNFGVQESIAEPTPPSERESTVYLYIAILDSSSCTTVAAWLVDTLFIAVHA